MPCVSNLLINAVGDRDPKYPYVKGGSGVGEDGCDGDDLKPSCARAGTTSAAITGLFTSRLGTVRRGHFDPEPLRADPERLAS